jgi:hypothetical protein
MIFGVDVCEQVKMVVLLSRVTNLVKDLRSLDCSRKEDENISQMVETWNNWFLG